MDNLDIFARFVVQLKLEAIDNVMKVYYGFELRQVRLSVFEAYDRVENNSIFVYD